MIFTCETCKAKCDTQCGDSTKDWIQICGVMYCPACNDSPFVGREEQIKCSYCDYILPKNCIYDGWLKIKERIYCPVCSDIVVKDLSNGKDMINLTCNRCHGSSGPGENRKDWIVMDGKAYCPACTENHDGSLKSNDKVNHPSHYNAHPSGVECIDIVKHYDFCIGNAIKYLWRAGLKDGSTKLEDLKKSHWYISKAIDEEESKCQTK